MNARHSSRQSELRRIEPILRELSELWPPSATQTHRRQEPERATARLAWLASSEGPRTNYRNRAKIAQSARALIERIAADGTREASHTLEAIEAALANTETGAQHAIDQYAASGLRIYALRHRARCDKERAADTWVRILKLIMTEHGAAGWVYAMRDRPPVRFEEQEAQWALEAARELVREARASGREPRFSIRLEPIGHRLRSRLQGTPRHRRLKLADKFEETVDELWAAADGFGSKGKRAEPHDGRPS